MRHRNKLASTIANSELLYLFVSGGSGQIAEEAALKFFSLGFRTFVFAYLSYRLAAAKLVTPRDVTIAVTYSGNQKVVAEALHTAKGLDALSAITSFEQSLISKSADVVLLISVPLEILRGQTGAHRVAQIAVLDALAILCPRNQS